MVSLLKVVKPNRIKEKDMYDVLYNAVRRQRAVVLKDYEGTVETWKEKPKFVAEVSITNAGPRLEVYTTNEIYRYVDEGTRPHEIWAGAYTGKSDKKVLAFPSAFSPKTKPNSLKSGAGSKGKVDTFRPYVNHTGTEARNFSEQIYKKNEKSFKREMEKAMKEAAKVSGHGM